MVTGQQGLTMILMLVVGICPSTYTALLEPHGSRTAFRFPIPATLVCARKGSSSCSPRCPSISVCKFSTHSTSKSTLIEPRDSNCERSALFVQFSKCTLWNIERGVEWSGSVFLSIDSYSQTLSRIGVGCGPVPSFIGHRSS